MQLYGSLPSPYVRRTRLALAGQSFEFIPLNIYEGPDRARLIALNPTRKIPMLVDGDKVIFDSGVIYRYLAEKFGWGALSWGEENNLSLINAANDSMVELFLCKKSGLDTNEDKLFFNLQRERVAATLQVLADKVVAGEFASWRYPAMALYSLLDWAHFRQTTDLTVHPVLLQFLTDFANEVGVSDTDPRLVER